MLLSMVFFMGCDLYYPLTDNMKGENNNEI